MFLYIDLLLRIQKIKERKIMDQEPVKLINIKVPAKLYDMLKRLANRKNTTMRAIIIQYLEWLSLQNKRENILVHVHKKTDFALDESTLRKLHIAVKDEDEPGNS
jgi:hypothetical protein